MKRPNRSTLPKRPPLGKQIKTNVAAELDQSGLGKVEVLGLLEALRGQVRTLTRRGQGLAAVVAALEGRSPKLEQLVDGLDFLREHGACLFSRSEVAGRPWCRECADGGDLLVKRVDGERVVLCASCGVVVEEGPA